MDGWFQMQNAKKNEHKSPSPPGVNADAHAEMHMDARDIA